MVRNPDQTGAVTLGDDVEIGSNSNIDRGAMSDTTVGNGTKIDNQVQIGHNCKIGSHTVIAAKTGISGSVTVGNYCIIGGGVGTVGHIEIADKTTIGGGTSVTHSITESGQHVAGIFPDVVLQRVGAQCRPHSPPERNRQTHQTARTGIGRAEKR